MPDHHNCLIRGATPNDLDALIDLCEEHAAYEGTSYDRHGKKERLSLALFSTPPRLYAWVVEQNGTLVGYATATEEFSTWDAAAFFHMDCLYLRDTVRRKGLGRLLVREVTYLARRHGCINVQWQTPLWNEHAINFYQRLGAEGKPKMRFYLPDKITEIPKG